MDVQWTAQWTVHSECGGYPYQQRAIPYIRHHHSTRTRTKPGQHPTAHPPTQQNLDANFLSVYAITRFYTIGQTVYHHNPKCGTVAHTIQPNSVSGCTTVPTQTHQPATQPRNRSNYLQLRITLKRNSGCSTKPFNHN